MRRLSLIALALPALGLAARIPAGIDISVRLTEKVATESTAAQALRAVVIAPVVLEGAIVLPAGAELTGEVTDVKAAADGQRAQIRLHFTHIGMGGYRVPVSAVVSSLENARETVSPDGLITGIDVSQTYSARLNQGVSRLEGNEKFSGLAGLIQGAKQALKIQDADPNIDYDAGVELTLRLAQPLDWRGPLAGPGGNPASFPNERALADLVNSQPFRTVAAKPPQPSDMTNIMFVGTEEEVRAAFEKAGWSSAARLTGKSRLETARALIEDRGYKEGPMSVLLLDGQPPDMTWQKGNNTFSKRHHLRVFRRPGTFAGKPVWVCSSTHDIGIDFSERDRTFIHKVDSEIDRERAKVVADLLFTGLVKALALVDRPAVPQTITNATGDSLRTDGRMAVLLF